MTMSDSMAKSYLAALDAMNRSGPRDLRRNALVQAEEFGSDIEVSDAALRAYLAASSASDDELRNELHIKLAKWDNARPEDADWTAGTGANTPERRAVVLAKLGVELETAQLFGSLFPVHGGDGTVVIAKEWNPWYSEELIRARDFYWSHYANHLRTRRGWDERAITSLHNATRHVVERLSEPTRSEPYQAKGLVVGYVQSGKTANFTGVIAKAIDAGYRLIIVLTGTTNMLREQTQRRVDMELVGRENILRGVDIDSPEALAAVDYQEDEDWRDGKFVEHGCRPADVGKPDIHRMTTRRFDYQSLRQGISALDFDRPHRSKPLNHPDNLLATDARLMIVKKNGPVLTKLVKDLKRITARLHQIPALIIDDESDQASVNTTNPKRWQAGKKSRTTINRLISELLGMLPRGQYVGYTATPFANVFIDPSDAQDIFPKDFLISLERPPGYMGAEDFHDLDSDVPLVDRTFENSKERAHLRLVDDPDSDGDLRRAIDIFVLAGAVKLYRQDRGYPRFKHHTMLVHEAMHTDIHRTTAEQIRRIWDEAGYYSSASHARLRAAFENDLSLVSSALVGELPTPAAFEDLIPYLGEATRRISPAGNPVLVVNSDQDIEQDEVNFDHYSVWRILVGGNKLARGFTVEGLTVSYYVRAVKNADALMQMGRWFGFREGYRDLVRLFLTPDLRDAFESVCLDERSFREELELYAAADEDGRPRLTPAEVPPLVSSHGIRPTTAAKMYNAVLVERRGGNISGNIERSSGYPPMSEKAVLERNVDACVPLIAAASELETLSDKGKPSFDALIGTVSHDRMVSVLGELTWATPSTFAPDLEWIRKLGPDVITDWRVILPQQKRGRRASLRAQRPVSLHGRAVDSNDKVRGNSTSAHREVIHNLEVGATTGKLILYPVVDRKREMVAGIVENDPPGVVMAVVLMMPRTVSRLAKTKTSGVLQWRTVDSSKPPYALVDG
ncbi:Z1 domain-containing protein [Actinokineospora auranticolor]|uniref:Z1 domain-containing protein n=1 Tax=Actinokineospora auranticolor TaxID=155976 RepID=A0A2S6H115_9PSEU|nr:Z1 domain-containing protein [Actinokineospora auranticolor]PPK71179.1 Z1 domain-containing protein [Actinokineospora auranticolor]